MRISLYSASSLTDQKNHINLRLSGNQYAENASIISRAFTSDDNLQAKKTAD